LPNKKAHDAYISAEALPKIQLLNSMKFGPEIISKDKAAKALWKRRIQVSGDTSSTVLGQEVGHPAQGGARIRTPDQGSNFFFHQLSMN